MKKSNVVVFVMALLVSTACVAMPDEDGKAAPCEGSAVAAAESPKECSVRFIANTHRRVKTCK